MNSDFKNVFKNEVKKNYVEPLLTALLIFQRVKTAHDLAPFKPICTEKMQLFWTFSL